MNPFNFHLSYFLFTPASYSSSSLSFIKTQWVHTFVGEKHTPDTSPICFPPVNANYCVSTKQPPESPRLPRSLSHTHSAGTAPVTIPCIHQSTLKNSHYHLPGQSPGSGSCSPSYSDLDAIPADIIKPSLRNCSRLKNTVFLSHFLPYRSRRFLRGKLVLL